MRLSCGYETRKARVEMLPLIDVVFLLLVFFIYAMLSMVVHHGLKIELPSAGTAVLEQKDYIDITIDAENHLYLNSRPVGLDELTAGVLELRGNRETMLEVLEQDELALKCAAASSDWTA